MKTMEPICALKDIYKELYQFEKDFLDSYSITINEAMLLCCMKDGNEKTAGALCDYIGLSNSRVSKVITAVEKKGYISRSISPEDKRQMLFSLTQAGKEKIRSMQQAQIAFEQLYAKLETCIQNGVS